MSIGQAYSDTLTTSEQQALHKACDMLIDNIFDGISGVQDNKDVADTMIGALLPPRYTLRYTPLFLR